ncbi:MAG: hypothetical protein GY820_29685 [Gammaproteobacteria bacterium]|nr:hypothetical protein [Gammaproteobacteria bacterium]
MAKRLRNNIDLMRVLHTCKPNLRKAIIKEASGDVIRCLCDCSHNILNGNIKVTPKQKKQLIRFKNQLRALTDKKKTLDEKRQVLIQRGAGLPLAILAPIIAIASALLTK